MRTRKKASTVLCFRCRATVSTDEAVYMFTRRDAYTGIVRPLSEDERVAARELGTPTDRIQAFRRMGGRIDCACPQCAEGVRP
jgi:hypothetical protein